MLADDVLRPNESVATWAFGKAANAAPANAVLIADNSLDDWTKLVPTELHDKAAAPTPTGCTASGGLVRYGVLYNEGWLYAAVELAQQPFATENRVVVIFVKAGDSNWQAQIPWGGNTFSILDDVGFTRGGSMAVPFTGKILELGINAAWLGWQDGKPPTGLQVRLATYSNTDTPCDFTDLLTPSLVLPGDTP
jgi:hypothetical protein